MPQTHPAFGLKNPEPLTRGAKGIPGPPGPAGPKGATGATGARGAKGQNASVEDAGSPSTLNQFSEIEHTIEDIYKELEIQMKRMSQIQQQVDDLRMKFKQLGGTSN
jgi:hypothetical protein